MNDSQKILDFIKDPNNHHPDGIDISHGIKLSIEKTYKLLYNMEKNGLIRRQYFGIKSYYVINE